IQGLISGIWGIASILGPLAGGIIVENWSWRWIFFVNLPLIAIATLLIVIGLKEFPAERRATKLDLAGAGTLLVGLLLIFSALTQSAHERQSLNAGTVGLIVAGTVTLTIFYIIERRAAEPIIPLDLFHLGLYRSSISIATLCAMGVFGAISYLPLYLQGVLGITATGTGLIILALSMGWTIGSLTAGQAINKIGYRLVAAAGMLLLALGYGVFVLPYLNFGIAAVVLSASAIGIGMGMANLTTLVAAQTAVAHHRIGVATSTVMLFRTFGGAFAVSLMGTVMLGHMQTSLTRLRAANTNVTASVWEKLANPQNLLEPATRGQISPELLPRLIASLGDALWYAFLTGFSLMIVGVALSLSMADYTPATTPRAADTSRV
ncbi:MAG TPA: MFS transporter, partial [Candidatus Limnocylindrales bacterium]|nr:MFS transporter [Candidatus Limnocylindrales bacterium]